MTPGIISLVVSIFAVLVLLWFFIEEVWDLKLFVKRPGHESVVNLSTLRGMALVKHHERIVPVDVRPEEQFRKSHLPGARNVPFEKGCLDEAKLESLERSEPILVYCDGGHRSRRAISSLVDAGFTRIFHLNRGFLVWRFFGGSTERSR